MLQYESCECEFFEAAQESSCQLKIVATFQFADELRGTLSSILWAVGSLWTTRREGPGELRRSRCYALEASDGRRLASCFKHSSFECAEPGARAN